MVVIVVAKKKHLEPLALVVHLIQDQMNIAWADIASMSLYLVVDMMRSAVVGTEELAVVVALAQVNLSGVAAASEDPYEPNEDHAPFEDPWLLLDVMGQ
ncbi:unnamed protein product [Somion occarium]|uniref:Uncharacterized protein n=1 Tax=Somion occarium TaxID=3059160 RepID=A0ABP1D2J4_9APHY